MTTHTSALSFTALDSTSMYHCMFSGTTLFSLASSVCKDLRRDPRLANCIAWLMLATASCTERRRERGKGEKGEGRGMREEVRGETGDRRGERGEGKGWLPLFQDCIRRQEDKLTLGLGNLPLHSGVDVVHSILNLLPRQHEVVDVLL